MSDALLRASGEAPPPSYPQHTTLTSLETKDSPAVPSSSSLLSVGSEGIMTTGAHLSIWQRTLSAAPSFDKLTHTITTDTVIVGAGISGLLTAYHLVRAGYNVVILEGRQIAGGESGRTTAHLSSYMDDTIVDLEKKFGKEQTQLIVNSHIEAIDSIERIVNRHHIDCNFERVPGYLIRSDMTSKDQHNIEAEWAAMQRCQVYPDAVMTTMPSIASLASSLAIEFKNQAQFHPTKFLYALAKILSEGKEMSADLPAGSNLGTCSIFGDTRVTKYQGGKDSWVQTKDAHKVFAQNIVLATNVPLNLLSVIDSVKPMRTYVIAAKLSSSYGEKFGSALFWDDVDPYHYVRILSATQSRLDSDLLIVGGEDHIVGREGGVSAAERYRKLEDWARTKWAITEVTDRWSGQVEEPFDDIAYIGRNPHDQENVFIVSGDSGMGLTHGAIAGQLLCDLINKQANRYAKLYDPSRVKLRAAPEYLAHNTASQFQFARWLSRSDVRDIEDIPRCSGAVMRDGLTHVAVYKDKDGCIQKCSAVCTHLKGIVRWNDDEKTWDCPVHGSRFSPTGDVLNGPAIMALEKLRDDHATASRNVSGPAPAAADKLPSKPTDEPAAMREPTANTINANTAKTKLQSELPFPHSSSLANPTM